MNIQHAKICLDCDEIYDNELTLCPICNGRIGWPLKEWIGTIGREGLDAALSHSAEGDRSGPERILFNLRQ